MINVEVLCDVKSNFSPLEFSINYNSFISPKTSSKNKFGTYFIIFLIALLTILAILNFDRFCLSFVLIANLIFAVNFIFKVILFFTYLKLKPNGIFKTNYDLPIYTILLPCYKEKKETLQGLIYAISNLKYAKDKLDIKFLLEDGDDETMLNLKGLEHDFEVLIVPNANPKTKPKACNFGLYFARGEFVVIYDAEDRPESNQLMKALHNFRTGEGELICIQCRLNFYNYNTNILSKCFSIEYLMWFNAFLPAVVKLGFFIPLGGTSNHFKTKELIEIGGWDAYNVTEDAELGIRIGKHGYKNKVIDSYTFEEAPFKLENWVMQRTRWMKGYMQTFIVHILDFKGNFKFGFLQTMGIMLLVGFSFFSFFLIPLTMFFAWFVDLKGSFIFWLLLFNLSCIILYTLMFFIVIKREKFAHYKFAFLLMPFYFILHIISSVLAFFEFFCNPYYWYRTEHSVKNTGKKKDS